MNKYLLGNFYLKKGRYKDALALYNQSKLKDKKIFWAKGYAYYKLNQIDSATKNLEVAYAFDEKDENIGIFLSILYLLKDKKREAVMILSNLNGKIPKLVLEDIKNKRYEKLTKYIKKPKLKYRYPTKYYIIFLLITIGIITLTASISFYINKIQTKVQIDTDKNREYVGLYNFPKDLIIFKYKNRIEEQKDIKRLSLLIKEKRYNEAIILSNKILLSNANIYIKDKAKFLRTFIKTPYNLKFNPPIDKILKNEFLYLGSFIKSYGKITQKNKNSITININDNPIYTGIVFWRKQLLIPYKKRERIKVFGRIEKVVPEDKAIYIEAYIIEKQ